MSINHVHLLGRISATPELKEISKDFKTVNFSLAVSDRWKDKQTCETKEVTDWINCQANNRTAETICSYVQKGDLLYVDGKIKTRSYEKDNQKHTITYVQVDHIELMPNNRKSDNSGQLPPSESINPQEYEPDSLPF